MRNLIYKEFQLWWPPAMFLISLCSAFLLIPNWPFFIAFGYIFIAINGSFLLGRANHDILFTVSLPIRKRDTVLGKVIFITMVELLQVVVAVPFAIINNSIYLKGSVAGMNPNFAFFGFVLILYAIFNLIFFPMFFKTAYKSTVPMILSIAATIVYAGGVSVAIELIPTLRKQLDGLGTSHLASQLPVLTAGMVLFALLTWLAYRISADRFEKVNL